MTSEFLSKAHRDMGSIPHLCTAASAERTMFVRLEKGEGLSGMELSDVAR